MLDQARRRLEREATEEQEEAALYHLRCAGALTFDWQSTATRYQAQAARHHVNAALRLGVLLHPRSED